MRDTDLSKMTQPRPSNADLAAQLRALGNKYTKMCIEAAPALNAKPRNTWTDQECSDYLRWAERGGTCLNAANRCERSNRDGIRLDLHDKAQLEISACERQISKNVDVNFNTARRANLEWFIRVLRGEETE